MAKLDKKAQIGNLYSIIMVLGMIGILLGVVLTVLGKMAASTGITTKAETAINNTITAVSDIPTSWLPILVIVAIAGIILFLVMRFGSGAGKR